MSDNEVDNKGGNRGRGGAGSGQVRQSFSHGRSKAVVVETKRKRVMQKPGATGKPAAASTTAAKPAAASKPAGGAAAGARGGAPKSGARGGAGKGRGDQKGGGRNSMLKTLSAEEHARRLKALELARKNESARQEKEAAEAKAREEARVRALKEKADKEAREKAEAEAREAKAKAEAEAKAKAEAEAKAKAEADKKAKAEAAAKAKAERPARGGDRGGERGARGGNDRGGERGGRAGGDRGGDRAGRPAGDRGPRPAGDRGPRPAGAGNRPAGDRGPRPAGGGASRPAGASPADAQAEAASAASGRGQKEFRNAPKKAGGAATPDRKQPSRNSRGGDDRRRSGKLTISRATSGDEGGRQRSMASMRRRQQRAKGGQQQEAREKIIRDVQVPDAITVQELANRMAERGADVVKALFKSGMMVTINSTLDADTAELVVEEFGHRVQRVSDSDVEDVINTEEDRDEDLKPRAPVVTIMGHVDHGKTSLLDALRETNVVSGEAGGITQHIGAYQVKTKSGAVISFLDTPGHAAFTSMRARGAQVTDIVILVVAADDSVMPQTIEAIAHSKAAGVPMIVAINKCDRPAADAQKVRTELLQHEVFVEEMGGDVLDVEVSAKTGQGLDTLLENIAMQAELLDLKANPDRPAEGAVIEAKLDVGRGPVATVLVQRGTLRKGDIFVVGEQSGKVRALINDQGRRVDEAGPSVPVEVLGLSGTPEAGDVLNVVESEAKAREIADYRIRVSKEKQAAAGAATTLDQLMAKAKADESVSELPILVKADVQGSTEAIIQAMDKIGNDEVRVRVLHSGVGAITETDVGLAEASGAPIMGFNVRANARAREAAHQKGVEIRYYSVIYDLMDDVKKAAEGLLTPEVRETFIGYANIKEVFKVTGVGKVAGCEVSEGVARRAAGVRLLRDNVVIHEGKLKTLKRFKDEVAEVRAGQECGMAFENYDDIRPGDVIEIFTTEEIQRSL